MLVTQCSYEFIQKSRPDEKTERRLKVTLKTTQILLVLLWIPNAKHLNISKEKCIPYLLECAHCL
jgi:hypothetical protein